MEEENKQNVETEVSTNSTVESESQKSFESKKQSKGLIIGIVFALVILGAGYMYMQNGAPTNIGSTGDEDMVALGPDQVVAKVNGTELVGSDLILQMTQAAQTVGLQSFSDADRETQALIISQSIDAIVNTELIVQASEDIGVTVSEEDVNAEFDVLVENIGGIDAAKQRLSELGISEEQFKGNLFDDLMIRRYLEATNDESVLQVSEEEIKAFYDQVTGGQTEGVPTLDEVRFQIEEQLKFQKQQDALVELVKELREVADIEVFI